MSGAGVGCHDCSSTSDCCDYVERDSAPNAIALAAQNLLGLLAAARKLLTRRAADSCRAV